MGKLSLRGRSGSFREAQRRLVAAQGLECHSPDTHCSRSYVKTLPLSLLQTLFPHTSRPHASPTWFCADHRGPSRRASPPRPCTWRRWTGASWAQGGFAVHPSWYLPRPRSPRHAGRLGNSPGLHMGRLRASSLTAVHTCSDSSSWQSPLSEFPQQREDSFP